MSQTPNDLLNILAAVDHESAAHENDPGTFYEFDVETLAKAGVTDFPALAALLRSYDGWTEDHPEVPDMQLMAIGAERINEQDAWTGYWIPRSLLKPT